MKAFLEQEQNKLVQFLKEQENAELEESSKIAKAEIVKAEATKIEVAKVEIAKAESKEIALKKLPMWGDQVEESEVNFEWPTAEAL